MNLETQWSRYAVSNRFPKHSPGARPALVGGMLAATGAAVFSLPCHANAAVVYSGPLSQSASWNNAPGVTDGMNAVRLDLAGNVGYAYGLRRTIRGQSTGSAVLRIGEVASSGGLKKLAKGSLINSALNFSTVRAALKLIVDGVTEGGNFAAGKPYYAGVKLTSGSASPGGDYGWVKLEYTTEGTTGDNSPYPGTIEVLGYAYQTDGSAIAAGETAVPEPASLASLALGVAGIAALASSRRKKTA